MSTAFVLSGGGRLGAVQVGLPEALAERHVTPDLLVGTAAGAVNAAFVAGWGTGAAAPGELEEIWVGLRRRDSFPLRPLHQMVTRPGTREALRHDGGRSRLIAANVRYDHPQPAQVPVHLVTTNLLSGAEVLLAGGDAASAVLASAAIPGIFAPVRRGGLTLVDGGARCAPMRGSDRRCTLRRACRRARVSLRRCWQCRPVPEHVRTRWYATLGVPLCQAAVFWVLFWSARTRCRARCWAGS